MYSVKCKKASKNGRNMKRGMCVYQSAERWIAVK